MPMLSTRDSGMVSCAGAEYYGVFGADAKDYRVLGAKKLSFFVPRTR